MERGKIFIFTRTCWHRWVGAAFFPSYVRGATTHPRHSGDFRLNPLFGSVLLTEGGASAGVVAWVDGIAFCCAVWFGEQEDKMCSVI